MFFQINSTMHQTALCYSLEDLDFDISCTYKNSNFTSIPTFHYTTTLTACLSLQLTEWSTLERLIVTQLIKKLPTFMVPQLQCRVHKGRPLVPILNHNIPLHKY